MARTSRAQALVLLPPFTQPMVPCLGPPALCAYLRRHGVAATYVDLNIRLHDEVIGKPAIVDAIHELFRQDFAALDARPRGLTPEMAEAYLRSLRLLAKAQILRRLRPQAAARYRAPHPDAEPLPFGYPAQRNAFRLIELLLSMLGIKAMALRSTTGASLKVPQGQAAELLLDLFTRCLPPDLLDRATLFGISVLYDSQIGCARLLAKYLRQQRPEIPIIAGGPSAPACLEQSDASTPEPGFDVVATGEGERLLLELCTSARAPHQRPGREMVTLRGKAPAFPLPAPAFEPAELELYWGRPITLPAQIARGCYWGACAFCAYRGCYSGPYRTLDPAGAVGLIAFMQRQYGCHSFQLEDDCMPPGLLAKMAPGLSRLPSPVRWSASVRFEPGLTDRLLCALAQAGCRRLTFGMETVSQRLLDLVRKGTAVEHYLPTLRACKKHGISVHLNWIAGLPTESPEELEDTLSFLGDHADLFSYQFGHVFRLEPGSPFGAHPEQHGLDRQLLATMHDPERVRRSQRAVDTAATGSVPAPDAESTNDSGALPSQRLRWADDVAIIPVHYGVSQVQQAALGNTGHAERLSSPEWALYDPWNDAILQLSTDELPWLSARLRDPAEDTAAATILGVLHERGFVTSADICS